jgi:hypothetical protein
VAGDGASATNKHPLLRFPSPIESFDDYSTRVIPKWKLIRRRRKLPGFHQPQQS